MFEDQIFEFLKENNYIEHNLQKGFIPKLSGTFEHTAQMGHIIDKARLKQRSLIVTLLDLKNAFGEVHHNLISAVYKYHHIPEQIDHLVKDLYSNFNTTIMTSHFETPFIKVGRGVLQGDCLSPLTFNMCFNTFIQYIKSQNFQQLGFKFKANVEPRHWFQFADDVSVISGTEHENQILLNAFTRWCQWSMMIIRVDKCKTFGVAKIGSQCKQYLPKRFLNNELVPQVKLEESFTYLGRHFNYAMDDAEHKSHVQERTNEILQDIDKLPLHPRHKIALYKSYLLSQISWDLTVANIGLTWVKNNLDNVVSLYLRRWLEIPINGTLDICLLSRSRFGLDLILPSTKLIQCQSVIRQRLKNSPNADIRAIYEDTGKETNVQYDTFQSTRNVIKSIRKTKEDRVVQELKNQGLTLPFLLTDVLSSTIELWSIAQSALPRNIFNFTVSYLNNSLPTRKNMVTWASQTTLVVRHVPKQKLYFML